MARMSEREARRAGLLPPKRKPKQRAAPRAGAESYCVTHDARFLTDAAETHHVDRHHGCRIETPQHTQGEMP